jgi:hypothetical protein
LLRSLLRHATLRTMCPWPYHRLMVLPLSLVYGA